MKRLGEKGVDVVTLVHKLVAVVWVVSAGIALVLVVWASRAPDSASGAVWSRIGLFQTIAAFSSIPMVAIGLVYGIATPWGFGLLRNRLVLAKWALLLCATGFGGPSISAARTHSVTAVITLTLAELAALVAAMVVGVFLERSRHAGRFAG